MLDEALELTLELMLELGGEAYWNDFQYLFATSKLGSATPSPDMLSDSMKPLLELI